MTGDIEAINKLENDLMLEISAMLILKAPEEFIVEDKFKNGVISYEGTKIFRIIKEAVETCLKEESMCLKTQQDC